MLQCIHDFMSDCAEKMSKSIGGCVLLSFQNECLFENMK